MFADDVDSARRSAVKGRLAPVKFSKSAQKFFIARFVIRFDPVLVYLAQLINHRNRLLLLRNGARCILLFYHIYMYISMNQLVYCFANL